MERGAGGGVGGGWAASAAPTAQRPCAVAKLSKASERRDMGEPHRLLW